MIHCCTNPRYHMYYLYGGRGIGVSDAWLNSFDQFVKDMGPRPSREYVLDRKDKEVGFSKDNCRWSTRTAQARNTRKSARVDFEGATDPDGKLITMAEYAERTGKSVGTLASRLRHNKKKMSTVEAATAEAAKLITHEGETLPISAWAARAGLIPATLACRLRNHWPMDKALSEPAMKQDGTVTYQGRTQSLGDWCKELNLHYHRTHKRLTAYGWTPEEAFTLPIGYRRRYGHS